MMEFSNNSLKQLGIKNYLSKIMFLIIKIRDKYLYKETLTKNKSLSSR